MFLKTKDCLLFKITNYGNLKLTLNINVKSREDNKSLILRGLMGILTVTPGNNEFTDILEAIREYSGVFKSNNGVKQTQNVYNWCGRSEFSGVPQRHWSMSGIIGSSLWLLLLY